MSVVVSACKEGKNSFAEYLRLELSVLETIFFMAND
jgi:hypothetical protein